MMNKLGAGLVLGAALVAVAGIALVMRPPTWLEPGAGTGNASKFDARSATYTVDGKTITFNRGEAYVQYGEGELIHFSVMSQADGLLNEDQLSDAGVLLVADTEGGKSYYAAGLLSADGKWEGTNGFFVGKGIGIETIDVDHDRFIVNYFVGGAPEKPSQAALTTKEFQARLGVFVELTPTPSPSAAPSPTP